MKTATPLEQLIKSAQAAYAQEEYQQAAQAFQAAEQTCASAGDVLAAAEMANNRSVALLQGGEAQAALEAVGGTPETFAAAGDKRRQALALGNRAAALAALRQPAEAEALYWQSARLLEEIGETGLRAAVLQAISKLQFRSGRYLEALSALHNGLDKVEHPSLPQRALKHLVRVPLRMLTNRGTDQ